MLLLGVYVAGSQAYLYTLSSSHLAQIYWTKLMGLRSVVFTVNAFRFIDQLIAFVVSHRRRILARKPRRLHSHNLLFLDPDQSAGVSVVVCRTPVHVI